MAKDWVIYSYSADPKFGFGFFGKNNKFDRNFENIVVFKNMSEEAVKQIANSIYENDNIITTKIVSHYEASMQNMVRKANIKL